MTIEIDLPSMPGLLGYFRKHAPAYLQSIYSAVLDNKVQTGLVVPHDAFHAFKGDLPFVVTVSDDVGKTCGPAGFDPDTLNDLFRKCRAAVVISVWPEPLYYNEAVDFALRNQCSVAIVETNMAVESEWLRAIVRINPGIRLAVWSTQKQGVA